VRVYVFVEGELKEWQTELKHVHLMQCPYMCRCLRNRKVENVLNGVSL